MENIDFTALDWLSAIWWTFIGILFVKLLIYPYKKKFDLLVWVKENTLDVLRGFLLTLISVKLGDVVFQILGKYVGVDVQGIQDALHSINLDAVQSALVLAIVFQLWLYKRRKKKQGEIVQSVTPPPGNPPGDDPDDDN